jgi:hypothetical protein
MSKIIVFVEGKNVTGYEVVQDAHVEAARIGLSGDDAVTFDRVTRQIGADVMATILKNIPRKTADEALNELGTKRGKAFLLVDRLPEGDVKDWTVEGGKVVLKATA